MRSFGGERLLIYVVRAMTQASLLGHLAKTEV